MSLKQDLDSTHRNQRNFFTLFIAGNSGRVRIKHRFAIHQEPVLMMAMTQLYLREPPAIRLPVQPIGRGARRDKN
jgi:hypothetical protein